MADGQARRKVLFYRALPVEGGPDWDPAEVCARISALSGIDSYYEDSGFVTRAEVIGSARPQCIRFFKVRRNDLPGVDTGDGDSTDLDLDPDEGLAEAIHVCLFPNGVVGAEFFFYGPRIGRFEDFVNIKLDLPCTIREMVRHDVLEQALNYDEIRLLRVKVDPSATSQQAAASARLGPLMDVAEDFDAEVYADLTLRSNRNDQSFTAKVKDMIGRVKEGDADVDIFEKLEIDGRPDLDGPVRPLDVLSERFYRMVEIPYRTERYRDLNTDAAFSAIRQAYRDIADDLPRDGLVA